MKPAWARKSKGMTFLYRIVLFFAWCVFKLFYRHRVYGLEHFYEGSAIIAANHASFYDPPILAISWPQEVHFLARETLFSTPGFGAFIRALNAHPVSGSAGDIGVFKTICALLQEGKKVIMFPEGSRSRDNQLKEIKPGIGLLISRSHSAIIPAYIHGAFQVWDKSRRLPKLCGKTVCVFGTPLKWEAFQHLDKKQAHLALSEQLSASINGLRRWYEAGAHGSPP